MTVYGNLVRFNSVSQVTATPGPNDPEVGQRFRVDDEDYIYVYNNGNTQISVGCGAILSGVTGYSVTVSSVTSVDFLVGVCKHATLTSATYGYLVAKGFSLVQMQADNSGAAGALLVLGDNGLFANKTISTGYIPPVQVKLMSAAASGSSGMAYISCY